MRVAVIGATGGVGQELVHELLGPDSPAVTVRAVARDPATGAKLWSSRCGDGRLELAQGDVTQPETNAEYAPHGGDVHKKPRDSAK